jgi:hypothetical protein
MPDVRPEVPYSEIRWLVLKDFKHIFHFTIN